MLEGFRDRAFVKRLEGLVIKGIFILTGVRCISVGKGIYCVVYLCRVCRCVDNVFLNIF